MYSIYDLAYAYIQRFYTEEPTKENKIEIIRTFEDLLYQGWTSDDMIKVFRAFKTKHPDETPNLDALFNKLAKKEDNLLRPDCFYYHNQLRLVPGPPRRELDYNSGEIKKISEEWFLEMRASYTLDDLADYFERQFHVSFSHHDRKKAIGAFKYLLKTYTLEMILFMIDAASNYIIYDDKSTRDFNVLNLSDYRSLAESALSEKRTETKLSGDDKIVPRKRVFTF